MPFIPALPYDYKLPTDLKHLALVIIDMQRDFLEPGGFGDALGNDVGRLQTIVPTLKQLLAAFRAAQLPIFHTIECHLPDLSDCPLSKLNRGNGSLKIGDQGPMGRILVLGEPGNGIIPELAPLPEETIIAKPGKGAFYATPFGSMLKDKGITHLLITGVTTEVCVQTTMREANDRGYECLMVEDCTESYFPEFKQSTLEMVRAQGGIVGWTAPAAAVIEAIAVATRPLPFSAVPVSMNAINLAVNGTLMRGLALNNNLLNAGATFVRETLTEPCYRLWSIDDRHPAMLRVSQGGVAIAVEVWEVPVEGICFILLWEPPGLSIGKVRLSDGETVLGVLGEPILCEGKREITQWGGWRAYTASLHPILSPQEPR